MWGIKFSQSYYRFQLIFLKVVFWFIVKLMKFTVHFMLYNKKIKMLETKLSNSVAYSMIFSSKIHCLWKNSNQLIIPTLSLIVWNGCSNCSIILLVAYS